MLDGLLCLLSIAMVATWACGGLEQLKPPNYSSCSNICRQAPTLSSPFNPFQVDPLLLSGFHWIILRGEKSTCAPAELG